MADKDLQNLILRAEALMKTNWIHGAQLLEKAMEDHPNDPRPMIAMGEFYSRRQLFNKAIKCFQSALKLVPNDNHLKLVIANTYFAEGDYRLAIVYYDQIVDPHPDISYYKALALMYLGNHTESIGILRDLVLRYNNNPFIFFLLIEQLMQTNDHHLAMEYINAAESKFGKHKHLLLLKALNYAHFENWLFAYNAFLTYENGGDILQSDHFEVYADCALKCGMPDKALLILEKAQENDPYTMVIYENLIRLLIEQKNYTLAKNYLKKARRFFPMLSPLLKLLQARLGRPSD